MRIGNGTHLFCCCAPCGAAEGLASLDRFKRGVAVWALASGVAEFAARVFMSRIAIHWIGADAHTPAKRSGASILPPLCRLAATSLPPPTLSPTATSLPPPSPSVLRTDTSPRWGESRPWGIGPPSNEHLSRVARATTWHRPYNRTRSPR